MRYKCCKCSTEWGGELDPDGYFSHGLCKLCLRELLKPTYRKRQREEIGSWECFGDATNHCTQENCKYRDLCLIDKGKT